MLQRSCLRLPPLPWGSLADRTLGAQPHGGQRASLRQPGLSSGAGSLLLPVFLMAAGAQSGLGDSSDLGTPLLFPNARFLGSPFYLVHLTTIYGAPTVFQALCWVLGAQQRMDKALRRLAEQVAAVTHCSSQSKSH